MTIEELAKELDLYYETGCALHDTNAFILCFAIKYASIIQANGYSAKDIVDKSSLSNSWATDMQKGIKLSKYVDLRKQFNQLITLYAKNHSTLPQQEETPTTDDDLMEKLF